MRRLCAITCSAILLCSTIARAAEPAVRDNDFVAAVGDSITEQKSYSMFIEDYLLMCQPAAGLRVTQFGWGGEQAEGFANRMANDLLPFHPTVVTTCYGMNDGGYSPMTPDKARRYRDRQTAIVSRLKHAGVRLIVVGSPGCVDADSFHNHNPADATMYNKTLGEERDIAREVAQSEGVVFADVFDPMVDVMTKMKTKYGKQYNLAGGDGVHPDRNGHLVMAYAFLKALGCTGDIGRISVDLKADKAEATAGHKVLACHGGTVELESTKYPFCFYGQPNQTGSTRGVLEFLPFNQDLNRFMLVVSNAPAAHYKVSWGQASKEFSADQLAAGINLAAEFLDNPFSEPFRQAEGRVFKQQEFETPLVKSLLHNLPDMRRVLPDESTTFDRLAASGIAHDKALCDASSAAVTPVKHTLVIEAVK